MNQNVNTTKGDKMKNRVIIDEGGYERQMEIVFQNNDGDTVYREINGSVVAAFLGYDSLEESAKWFESYGDFLNSLPDFYRNEFDLIKVDKKMKRHNKK